MFLPEKDHLSNFLQWNDLEITLLDDMLALTIIIHFLYKKMFDYN